MNLYLDSSALVKRYVLEPGTEAVLAEVAAAETVGSSLVTFAEVNASLARMARAGDLDAGEAEQARAAFRSHWADFARVPLTEALARHAADLAWRHRLRGYDAVQLAAALSWQGSLGLPVVMATFDRDLWRAGRDDGLATWPPDLRP